MVKLTVCLLIFTCLTKGLHCYKILFLTAIGTRSETHLFKPYAKALLNRGHEITFISTEPSGIKGNKNFEEILPSKSFTMIDFTGNISLTTTQIRQLTKDKVTSILSFDFSFIYDRCHQVFQNEIFKQFINRNSAYDLVITNAFFNNCFHGLISKFGAPFIAIHTMPADPVVTRMTGLRMPSSFVPLSFLDFSDKMNFFERFVNTWSIWVFSWLMDSAKVEYTKIYRHYLGQQYPWSEEIESNVSLLMSNSHFSIYFPRPLLPDVVEIAGIHCRPAQTLENKALKQFLDEASDGFILFSLGSVAQTSSLPKEIIITLSHVFKNLKQNIVLKWETDERPEMPSNVMMVKWLSQQDILGHPNIRLFISHGGALSTMEAVYHGVPVIGIPIFVDQDMNMRQMVSSGLGLVLELLELTPDSLNGAIQSVLQNQTFATRAKEMSQRFRDQPIAPLDNAVYWAEFVARHKGAHFMKSSARHLNWFQYHGFDVMAVFMILLGSSLYMIKILISCICCKAKKKNSLFKESSKKVN